MWRNRTLYTILAKPVPRLDYLLGKLLGVLIIIAGGIIVMDIVFCIVLWIKQGMVLDDMLGGLSEQFRGHPPQELVIAQQKTIAAQGLTWALQAGFGACS